nr:MAG TPA: hypothetical protein [Caudoviricetes sp.]
MLISKLLYFYYSLSLRKSNRFFMICKKYLLVDKSTPIIRVEENERS